MPKHVLLINGPNLNLLGSREPHIYGKKGLKEIESDLQDFFSRVYVTLSCYQSNHEGYLIDFLHEHQKADYIIINPAAFTHTSIALRDALLAIQVPFIEVHLSNIHERESFRHHSYLSDIATMVLMGEGVSGYMKAAEFVCEQLRNT